jgi:hypothetical protein
VQVADEEVQLELGIDDRALRKGLRDIERDFSKFGSSVESSVKGASASLDVFKGTFAGLVAFKSLEVVGKAIGAAFGFAVDTMGRAITEAAGAEVAINNLNQALIRSGQFTPAVSKELEDFSSQLQRTSTFTDDAAQGSLALLASLTKLDVEGLKSATQAAANLATVLGIDLDTATRLVAKGANGNVEAFGRYGLEIRRGATDTETFSNLLQVLNSRFGGAAQGQLKSYSGSLTSLSNSYGDLLEQLGFIVTKNPAVIGLFNSTRIALQGLGDSLSKQDFGNIIAMSISVALESFAIFIDAIDLVVKAFTLQVNALSIQAQLIPTLIAKAFAAVTEFTAGIVSSIPVLGGFAEKLANVARIASEGISASLAEDVQDVKNVFTDTSALDSFAASIRQVSKDTSDFAAQASVAAPPKIVPNVPGGDDTSEKDRATIDARKSLLAELSALDQNAAIQDQELQLQRDLLRNQNNVDALVELQSLETEKINIQAQAEIEKANLIKDSATREATIAKINAQTQIAIKKKQFSDEQTIEQARLRSMSANLAATSQFLQAGILLFKQNSKEGQALAVANALVSTYQAIANALATKPFIPAGLAAAALAGAQGFAAVRNITSQKFADGGIVKGSNIVGDRISAQLNAEEMVLNREQQAELFNMAKGRGRGQEEGPIVIQIDGREVFRAMREYSQGGMRFA